MIQIKRAYDPPARGDGRRILVERLWPRGMTKQDVAADEWRKEVAPSTEIRKEFGHRVDRWEDFRKHYRHELDANPAGWEPILIASAAGPVTLVYSARDTRHNGAVVLRDYLAEQAARRPPEGSSRGVKGARGGGRRRGQPLRRALPRAAARRSRP
jgi:uncharacterized protein YeaO (DUF488 family)